MRSHNPRLLVLVLVLASVACGGGDRDEPPAAVPGEPPTFKCQGNEPFWNLRIEGMQARYRTLADDDFDGSYEGEFQWDTTAAPAVFEWHGASTEKSRWRLSASIREERCLDTMSDETPPFTHWIRLRAPDGRELTGCCRTADAPAIDRGEIDLDALPVANLESLEADAWARQLIRLRPALEACLGRTSGSGPRVTYAWPIDEGMIGARLRDGDGGWFECVAARDGSSIDRFDALTSADFPLQHENQIVFTPATKYPPAGNCYEHEKVLDAQGELIGWLSFNTC
jgi:uncharacterized membrane protein